MTPEAAIHLRTEAPKPRSICYVGDIAPGSTALYRIEALKRLGQHVDSFDLRQFNPRNNFIAKIRFRNPIGPFVRSLNHYLIDYVTNTQPDLVLFDKPIFITAETIQLIKHTGAKVIFYVQDGPFGPRKDGCWKQFYKTFPLADLHCTLRKADSKRYQKWNLPHIQLMFSYAPEIHFAPPDSWTDKDRDRSISYIGHPHEDRPQFLAELAEQYKLPVIISGNGWRGILPQESEYKMLKDGFLLGPAYREAIWKSKINISFVTTLNEDDIAHKSIEITASGGFLLALRTEGHQACFEEDREAVFFSSIGECAEKAQYYLTHENERKEIARRGHLRAIKSGYSNDTQLARMLNYLD